MLVHATSLSWQVVGLRGCTRIAERTPRSHARPRVQVRHGSPIDLRGRYKFMPNTLTATTTTTAEASPEALTPSFWRERLAVYARPSVRRGLIDLATSVLPYVVLTGAMYVL